jgi:formylglycine-generating enzyme required for sulfatase activity
VYARAADPARGATQCATSPEDVGLRPVRLDEPATGDVTASGLVGMAGSLRELTRDDYRPYCSRCWVEATRDDPRCEVDPSARRTVRGGSFASGEDGLYAGLRDEGLEPSAWAAHIGFRCVRPATPTP